MRIERVTEVTPELIEAFSRLMPQLTNRPAPGQSELADLIGRTDTYLLVARDEEIVGALTLVVYRIPTRLDAVIHDVVVDDAARGQGVGEALTHEALRLASEAGVGRVSLTSRPDREAANRLYRRIGFEPHKTNVYVWRPLP
jgi:ribosomal protein S18 acetylase RimI-like enzyme